MVDQVPPQMDFSQNDPFNRQPPQQKHQKHGSADQAMIQSFRNETINMSTRLRIIEERLLNLRKKIQLTDQSALSQQKRFNQEYKIFNSELSEIKRSVDDIQTKLKLVIKEFSNVARKEDVTMLTKYVEFWEPANFVTRDELLKILDERLPKSRKKS